MRSASRRSRREIEAQTIVYKLITRTAQKSYTIKNAAGPVHIRYDLELLELGRQSTKYQVSDGCDNNEYGYARHHSASTRNAPQRTETAVWPGYDFAMDTQAEQVLLGRLYVTPYSFTF
jgi:hypothetical protein